MQLARHHGRAGGDRSGRRELHHEVPLHGLVGGAVAQVATHLDGVQRRQRVGVLARLQHKRGGVDAVHDLLNRPRQRLVLSEVPVHAVKVLLLERAFAAPQQRLIDDLALAKHVFQPVAGKRPGQPPADLDVVDQLCQRLEPGAGGVLQPGQFVEHHRVEPPQPRQGLHVVVVGHHHVGVRVDRGLALARCAHGHGQPQVWRPQLGLGRPDADGHALGGQHQKAFCHAGGQYVADRRQRQRGLARANGREDHRPVTLVQEIGGVVLVGSKIQDTPL